MSRRFLATADSTLVDEGFPTLEERIACVDPAQTVKGMFFDDLVKALGADFPALAPTLVAPPKTGRYLPFSSYPIRDHGVLTYPVARKLHPGLPAREGMRRVHRGNLHAFGRTTVGKVLIAMTGDVKSGFARLEEAFRVSRVAGEIHVLPIEERAVQVRFVGASPWVDCSELGTIEGMGTFYGKTFRVEATLDSPVDATYVFRWRD